MESFKCEICNKSFTGVACYQQHQASEKHQKKLRQTSGDCDIPKPANPDPMYQVHCSICMVSIAGWDNYQKHVNSLEHAIMVQKKSHDLLSQSVPGPFELKSERNLLMESTASVTGPTVPGAPYAECKPCQKQFSGREPYQQHLVSAGHKKKCGLSNQIVLNGETNPIIKNENNVDILPAVAAFAECKPCQKQFSGPEPYKQHLVSAGHKKKCGFLTMQSDVTDYIAKEHNIIDDQLYASQSSVSSSNLGEAVSHYFAKCDICQMEFNEAVTYQMHIVSDVHKMKESPLLPCNSSVENQGAFNCDVCVMKFTGPIPYKQHLVSAGHKKKVNLTEMSKQHTAIGSSSLNSNRNNEQISMSIGKYYCDLCKILCSGPIPFNTHILGREHIKNERVLSVESNLKKMATSAPFPHDKTDKIDSNLSSEVTSTVNVLSPCNESNMEVSSDDFKINDLNLNIENGDWKVMPEKYQMNVNDLNALHNLNIIPPERLDVTVFGPDDEIFFSSLKKSRKEILSEINEDTNVMVN